MSDEVKRKPLVGYMIFEEYAEDYSHWDGHIAYPDPTGANLAWQSPIKMIEYSTYDALKAENERLKTEAKALKGNWAGTWVNECELNDILKERDQLRAMCEKLAGVLRFYAERKHLEYLRLHGEEYVKEIGGKRAREALAEYEKLKNGSPEGK